MAGLHWSMFDALNNTSSIVEEFGIDLSDLPDRVNKGFYTKDKPFDGCEFPDGSVVATEHMKFLAGVIIGCVREFQSFRKDHFFHFLDKLDMHLAMCHESDVMEKKYSDKRVRGAVRA